jgi:hypothetical protein
LGGEIIDGAREGVTLFWNLIGQLSSMDNASLQNRSKGKDWSV